MGMTTTRRRSPGVCSRWMTSSASRPTGIASLITRRRSWPSPITSSPMSSRCTWARMSTPSTASRPGAPRPSASNSTSRAAPPSGRTSASGSRCRNDSGGRCAGSRSRCWATASSWGSRWPIGRSSWRPRAWARIFGANVALVAYEQSRCQPLLQLVFYRPMRWLFRVSWRSLRSRLTGRGFRRFWIYTARHADQPPLVRWAERTWATIYTKHVMSMRTPAGTVRLGKPMRPPRGVDPDLLRAPIRHPEVRRLVECFVPDPERATAGVTNWLDYRERMRYIVTYFRVYHTAPELLDPPFTPPIADALEADMWKGDPPRPLKEWYETKVAAYKTKIERRGVRGFILRRLYRSPIVVDPDAAELADLDLMDFISERRLDDRTEHEPPSER